MKTAIIILNFNNYIDTINCIESVEKYNTADIKYLIVDNGSTNKDVVILLNKYLEDKFGNNYGLFNFDGDSMPTILPLASFIVSNSNDGYAQGNNKGLAYAYVDSEVDKVMILNNDILFVQDIIPPLSKIIDETKDIAIVSPLLLKKNGVDVDYNCARQAPTVMDILIPYLFFYKDFLGIISKTKKARQILRNYPQEIVNKDLIPIELPSGSCMLLNKMLMQKMGGFDPHTFLYYEENILYKKVSRIGKISYLCPHVECIHLGASTTKTIESSFSLRAGLDSSQYYLKNFCELTIFHKLLMKIAYLNMHIKLYFMKIANK